MSKKKIIMTKELNLRIEKCEQCPYAIANTWNDDDFECSHVDIIRKATDGDSYAYSDRVLPNCPLKDGREQGVTVGVSVFLVNENNEILIGERQDGEWGLPGGGMIAGKTTGDTAVREIEEETGIKILIPEAMKFANFTNDIFLEKKKEHWITLYYICHCNNFKGKAERKEPKKCFEWRWVSLDNIPQPVFCGWYKEPNLTFLKMTILG